MEMTNYLFMQLLWEWSDGTQPADCRHVVSGYALNTVELKETLIKSRVLLFSLQLEGSCLTDSLGWFCPQICSGRSHSIDNTYWPDRCHSSASPESPLWERHDLHGKRQFDRALRHYLRAEASVRMASSQGRGGAALRGGVCGCVCVCMRLWLELSMQVFNTSVKEIVSWNINQFCCCC